MIIRNIKVSQFRNYSQCHAEFSPKLNWIYGANGQGKTNLVEAVHYVCHLDSFRTRKLSQLLKTDHREAILQAQIEQKNVLHAVRILISKKGRQVYLDHSLYRQASEYIRSFMALVFTPDDVNLFRNVPHERRKFFNRILSFTDPTYFKQLQEYTKILAQKNSLLKERNASQIPLWNEMLAKSGSKLMFHRKKFMEQVNEQLSYIFNGLSGRSESLNLVYAPSINLEEINQEIFLKQLEKSLARELQYGYAIIGPHRDDYYLMMDEKTDKDFFSQGEFRITNLSLKMTVNQLFYLKYQFYPVLIFDDLFSELDEQVIQQVFKYFESLDNQIFITSTTAPTFSLSGNLFHVVNGQLVCKS